MRVAIVHEWLERFAGSERVVEQMLHLFPQADLFALVDFMPERERGFLGGRPVRTSFIQKLPMARRQFRNYLGLMPLAIEQFDMSGYDLVLSSHHAVAKGVITGPNQPHVSYIHSPMRYAWDLQGQYLRESGMRGPKAAYARWQLHKLRDFDVRSATGVDCMLANSSYIAARIWKTYRRRSTVVHPPVDVARFAPRPGETDAGQGPYLVATRMVPYKRVKLVVEAFAAMPGRQLLVLGDGPELARVQQAAQGHANITLRPPVPGEELVRLMRQARAFIHAAEEDFGIAMVEAQAAGTPLIAFGRGGSKDIVIDINAPAAAEPTGVLFSEQSPESLIAAVEQFEARRASVTAAACIANAARFSEDQFRYNIMKNIHLALRGEADAVVEAMPPAAAA